MWCLGKRQQGLILWKISDYPFSYFEISLVFRFYRKFNGRKFLNLKDLHLAFAHKFRSTWRILKLHKFRCENSIWSQNSKILPLHKLCTEPHWNRNRLKKEFGFFQFHCDFTLSIKNVKLNKHSENSVPFEAFYET